jgi:peptidoglycan/xylan/chitin deacetylase (PgdA/CDA1 family)
VFVLNLHGIGPRNRSLSVGEQQVWIEQPFFEEILDYARNRRDVELTFDDANESDVTIGLPALCARGLRGKFFLVAGRIDQPGFLSRAQVEALVESGMTVGNHGMRHRPWAGLSRSDLQEELLEARETLQQMTGTKISEAACPFGSYNRRVIHALQTSGYQCVYTSDGGCVDPDAFLRSRNSIYNDWTLDTVQAVPAQRRHWLRRLKLLAKRWR